VLYGPGTAAAFPGAVEDDEVILIAQQSRHRAEENTQGWCCESQAKQLYTTTVRSMYGVMCGVHTSVELASLMRCSDNEPVGACVVVLPHSGAPVHCIRPGRGLAF
jgi:hypothetical protein